MLKASGGKLPPPSGLVQGSPGQPVFDMTDGEAMGDDENGESNIRATCHYDF